MSERVAVVGVGRMGANMARRLKECGFEVTAVYDVERRRATALAKELGCEAPRNLPKVTALAEVILTVVSDDAAMEEIFGRGDKSLLQGAEGRLFINCATVSPDAQSLAEDRALTAGAMTLEACMASSITQARDGTLYLMCGGSEAAMDRARPILEQLGKTVRYVGETGEAARLKLVVNMVMNANTAALAEGLGLAAALGMDLTMVREVFSETGAASRVLQTDGEDMQNRAHDCFFSAAHAAKDSGLALRMARRVRLELPVATATKRQYDRMVKAGLGQLDKSGIAELTFHDRGVVLHR